MFWFEKIKPKFSKHHTATEFESVPNSASTAAFDLRRAK